MPHSNFRSFVSHLLGAVHTRTVLGWVGILTGLLLLVPQAGRCQPLETVWSIKFGSDIHGGEARIIPLRAGGYAAVTVDDSLMEFQGRPLTIGSSFTLRRINEEGTIAWRRYYDESLQLGYPEDLTQVPNGDIVVAGTGGQLRLDAWVARFDSDGQERWSRLYGGSRDDWAFSVCGTSNNSCIFAGQTFSDDGDVYGKHDGPRDTRGWPPTDAWVVKLDSMGVIQLQQCWGGPGGAFATDALSLDTIAAVFGTTGSSEGIFPGSSPDKAGCYAVTIDSTLDVRAASVFNLGEIQCVCKMGGGGCAIVVGSLYSQPAKWLVEIDATGMVVSQVALTTMGIARAMTQTSDGDFVLAGKVDRWWATPFPNFHGGNFDAWIGKIDSVGNFKWQQALGGSGDDEFVSVCQSPDGSYVASGRAFSTDQDLAGLDTLSGAWVIKLREKTATVAPETATTGLNLHAVATGSGSTEIRYTLPTSTPVSLQVVDVLGRTLWQSQTDVQSAGEHTVTLPTLGHHNAPLWVVLHTSNQVAHCQLVEPN